jgi:molybdenum-dependent DNA-binding transcriptional regulator ModE
MPFPRPTRRQARARGKLGLDIIREKREERKIALWRQMARGECLKRAAHNVGISYTTAKQYRREA